MSSFDLDTIRHAISSRMQQGRLALSNPSAIVAALATTALFSLLPEGTLSQPLLDSILINIVGGGLGVSALYDFLKGFIDNLQAEEENQYSADEIRQRFEQALRERLEESGQDGRILRADVSRLLQHVEGINVALSAAPSELRQPLVDGLIELGSNFEEFRWILIEQSELLVEIRQRSKDMMSDVQRLVRQVARLEQNQQALPAKLKLLLLFQSEQSARPPSFGRSPRGEGESPYKGLPAFQKEDADYFFGREEQVVDLIHQLAQDKRFLAVIGPSGSGKSSLVRAGLLSQLDSNTAHQLLHSRDWRTVIFKPGSNPIAALANSVGSLSINIGSRALLRGLQDSPDELARAIRQQLLHNQPLHVRLLLIVDQFEELFTRCRDESERNRFIESLLHVSQTTACRTIVLLTMRADFYGHCASHPRLRSEIQDHHLLVGPLHESELRRVIELPAHKAGLQLEPGLTETIIKDVADAPGALPLLSQALLETWKRRQDNTLTRSGYEASGGVQQAIAQTADKVYNEQLTSEQQAIARQIFLRLVELGESEQYDTRRRTSRHELGDGASEVLLKLADARLIVTDQPSLNPSQQWEGSVEVAHEALIREWPTLRHWLDEDREGLRIHRHLTEAAQEWQQLGQDTGDLYRGARLAQACEWAEQHPNDLNALEQEFLQASQEAEEEARQRELEQARALAEEQRKRAEAERERADTERNARQRVGRFAMGLVVLFLLAVGIAFYANIKAEEALEAQATADVARDEADQKAQEALDAQAAAEVARNDADQKAEEARDAQAAAEVARNDADQKAQEARDAQATAEVAADLESEARTEAEKQARLARSQAKASQALSELSNKNLDHALLFALAAVRTDDDPLQLSVSQALWNTVEKTHSIRRVFGGRFQPGRSVAFSPSGKQVLMGSADGAAYLWNAETGQLVHSLEGHTDTIWSVAFSPDEKLILTGTTNGIVHLWNAETGQLLHLLKRHTDSINSTIFSPSGKLVLTGSSDNTARLWNTETGQELHLLKGHTGEVWTVSFSPSEKQVLTGSNDNTARLWNAKTGQLIHLLEGHTGDVNSVAFSSSGKLVLTGSDDNTARLWNAETGELLHVLEGYTEVISVAFSPNEKEVLTGHYNGTAYLWNTEMGQLTYSLEGHTRTVESAAFSPSGKQALTGSLDGTARLWNTETGQLLDLLEGHTDEIRTVAFSSSGKQILTSSDDGTARLWNTETVQLIQSLEGHTNAVGSVAFSPSGKQVLTGSWDDTARLWNAETGQALHILEGHTDGVDSVAFSPSGKQVLTGSWDDTARLWNAETGQLLHILEEHTDSVYSVAFSPSGKEVLTGSRDNTACLWDAETGQLLHILEGHTNSVQSVAFSPSEKQVLTASMDGTARLWQIETGQLIYSLEPHTSALLSVAFSRSGKQILTGSWGDTAHLWNPETGQLLHTLEGHIGRVDPVIFSPSGKQALTGGNEPHLWDTQMGQLRHILKGHTGPVWAVAFSPSGKQVLTGSRDNTARLWNTETGQPLFILEGHTNTVSSVAFNPSGKQVLTGSSDNTARLWRTDNALFIAKLTERVCGVWGLREKGISAEIPDWRGCEAELEAVKEDLTWYNELRGE